MMKKFCMKLATTTAGALLILAAPGQANIGIKSGPYAGVSVGLSNLSGNQDFNSANSDPAQPTFTNRLRLSGNSVGASIFGGYGYRVNCTWLAAELSYLFDRVESKSTTTAPAVPGEKIFKGRSTGAFGGALHIGYIPHEVCAVYAILGLEVRRFRMSFENSATRDQDVFSLNNKSYNSVAFVPGIGARLNLTKNVSMRAEYKFALHRSKSTSASAPNTGIGGTDTSTLKQSPRIQTFHLGVVYSF